MTLEDYLAARDTVASLGEPLLTYILLLAIASLLFSLNASLGSKEQSFRLSQHLHKVTTLLLTGGFLLFIWYHYTIYQNIIIEYPAFLQPHLPVESNRFIIPLWIEGEKLYFWSLLLALFMHLTYRQYPFSKKNMRPVHTALHLSLASLITLMYLLNNPFTQPLPILHSDITGWYQALETSDPQAIITASIQLFGRINFYNSTYMWTHPPMLFIAYTSLIITFIACCFMLYKREREYDELAYRFAKPGYLFLTFGMLIGYPWAITAWKDSNWWWDPKINASIMMWTLYSAYLHTRLYTRLWRATAALGILCFTSLMFTYLLTYIVPGIHSIAGTGGT